MNKDVVTTEMPSIISNTQSFMAEKTQIIISFLREHLFTDQLVTSLVGLGVVGMIIYAFIAGFDNQ